MAAIEPVAEVIADLDAITKDSQLTPAQKREQIAQRKAEAHTQALSSLPLTIGNAVIESIGKQGSTVVLTGHGGLNDPDTDDDTWTWRVVNPPLLVPDENGDVEIERLDGDEKPYIERYRVDPEAALLIAFTEVVEAQKR